jgi:hypothetical protein
MPEYVVLDSHLTHTSMPPHRSFHTAVGNDTSFVERLNSLESHLDNYSMACSIATSASFKSYDETKDFGEKPGF